MKNEIDNLLNQYFNWLKDRTMLREMNGEWMEITTPFLDRHNDRLQIYAKKINGSYLITDDSYTIEDLSLSGCALDSKKRQDLLKTVLNGFGVALEHNALTVKASAQNFARSQHNLIQAMLAVNDMFYLAKPSVESLFFEDVADWLDSHDVRYTPRVKFTGKSGYDYLFDFVIPKSKKCPERIVQAINAPNKNSTQAFIFSWHDTKENRAPNAQAYAVLNDEEKNLAQTAIDALKNYDVTPVSWRERESIIELLAK
ncbi:Domain of unknown function DUF1828 [Chloroherpeton thalassium ATCC 35110]|uniref:Lj965 prophage protein n=1 Tax=Chloroherpeton thalassium (strain ATCC 35110 / GB-78) TaxID=517418 RepID=B3QYC3_CHLT3|nr:DUF1829 domain-containing protein [Chloroherpeton thalassium]ACF15089.1 Domain of unknown function DUF1828 [Chloroherpeton thalassium ATCC 35110]